MSTPASAIPFTPFEGMNTTHIMIGLQKASMSAQHLPSNNRILRDCAILTSDMASAQNALQRPHTMSDLNNAVQTLGDILKNTATTQSNKASSTAKATLDILGGRIDTVRNTVEALQLELDELTKRYKEIRSQFQTEIKALLSSINPNDRGSESAIKAKKEELEKTVKPLVDKIEAYATKVKETTTELHYLHADILDQIRRNDTPTRDLQKHIATQQKPTSTETPRLGGG